MSDPESKRFRAPNGRRYRLTSDQDAAIMLHLLRHKADNAAGISKALGIYRPVVTKLLEGLEARREVLPLNRSPKLAFYAPSSVQPDEARHRMCQKIPRFSKLMAELAARPVSSIPELSARLKLPVRTLRAKLRALVDMGVVERSVTGSGKHIHILTWPQGFRGLVNPTDDETANRLLRFAHTSVPALLDHVTDALGQGHQLLDEYDNVLNANDARERSLMEFRKLANQLRDLRSRQRPLSDVARVNLVARGCAHAAEGVRQLGVALTQLDLEGLARRVRGSVALRPANSK